MKEWFYNKETNAFVFGSQNFGGGVFLDGPMSKKKRNKAEVWTGNAVYNGFTSNIGDCDNKGQAMVKVEAEYERMRKESEG